MRIDRWAGRAALTAALAVTGAVALSACATATPVAGGTTPPPASAAPTSPAPAPSVTAAQPSAAAAAVTTSYDAARLEWVNGATADSATQPQFWLDAATDLTTGETGDTDPTGYQQAVTQLKELAALPDAMQTAAQNATYHADITALNVFFKTPGLYS